MRRNSIMYKKKFMTRCSIALALVLAGVQGANVSAQETDVTSADQTVTEAAPVTESASSAEATPVEEATPVSEEVAPVEEVTSTTEAAPAEETTPTTEAVTPTEAEPELVPVALSTESSAPKDIVILHTNDIHGRLEGDSRSVIGVAKLDTIVQAERAKDQTTLLLDAGDAFQGLPISNSTQGEEMAKIMNAIGYDAMAVGNHEFDFSLEQAKKYKELLTFPILSANTYLDGVRLFQASTVVDKDTTVEGDEVVVIGVTTPETYTKTHPKNIVNVEFRDPITEVKNIIAEVEAQLRAENKTVNNYVVLAHLGIDSTTPVQWQGSTLAESLSTFEALTGKNVVVIDGHSHSVNSTKYGTNTVYNQTGSYLANIGKVVLKAPAAVEAGLIKFEDTKDVVPSETIKAMVDQAKATFDAENAKVIVQGNTVELNGERSNVRVRETNLGNAVADALYQYGQTGFANKTDLAVTNGGGLRATINKDADITQGDIIAVLPFGNIISQIEVKGSQIAEMFDTALKAGVQQKDGIPVLDENGLELLEANGAFLQISGGRVFFDPTLEAGSRVMRIEIFNRETGEYDKLDPTKTYYLATNDFLAAGGDGYTMLGGAREEGPSLDAVFAEFLQTADVSVYSEVAPNKRVVAIHALADADGDGVLNGEEFAHDTNPFAKEVITQNGEGVTVPALPIFEMPKVEAAAKDTKATLPATGEADSYLIFSAAVLTILAGVGLVATRKEEVE